MTFVEAMKELLAKHPKAELSPSVKMGSAANRAVQVKFKKEKGGMYAGRDADGTEVMVYYDDTARVISCTELESDFGPDEE
jgi:hypothetical protein